MNPQEMDQRFAGSKEIDYADFVPLSSVPVSFSGMEILLAPISDKIDKLTRIVNTAVAVHDPTTRKAGTITSALYNLTRTIDSLEKRVKTMADESVHDKEIDDLNRKIRHVHDDVKSQQELLEVISADIDSIKRSTKREREFGQPFVQPFGQTFGQSIPYSVWPIGFDSAIQPARDDVPRSNRDYYDDRDDRDYSRKQSRK